MKQSKTGILMIRGISNIFEQRKGYYKPYEQIIFEQKLN